MIKKSEPGFALTVRRCLQVAGRQLKAGCHRRERPTCPQAQETALSQTGPAQSCQKHTLPPVSRHSGFPGGLPVSAALSTVDDPPPACQFPFAELHLDPQSTRFLI